MGIINLQHRITNNNHEYDINQRSHDSLVFVSEDYLFDSGSPEVLILRVGAVYYKKMQKIEMPKKGLVVAPGKGVVVETKEIIATPLNVIGLIYGTGYNICRGGFVSSGKIDQGFCGNLRIGFYNAGEKNIIFKPDDILASVVFVSTDETLASPFIESRYQNEPAYKMTCWDIIKSFWFKNWTAIISIIIAIITLIHSIATKS